MMHKLLMVVRKNFLFLWHHKKSSLAIVAGPLIILLIASLAFANAQLQGVVVGVHAPGNDELVDVFTQSVGESFSLQEYEVFSECVDDLRRASAHACVSIINGSISFHVDPSRINLVYTILNALSSSSTEAAPQLGVELASGLITYLESMQASATEAQLVVGDVAGASDQLSTQLAELSAGLAAFSIDYQAPDLASYAQAFEQGEQDLDAVERVIDEDLSDVRSDAQLVHEHVLSTKEEITAQRVAAEELEQELEEVFVEYECSSYALEDLSGYAGDSSLFVERLEQQPSPTCSFIFTYQNYISEQVEELRLVERELEVMDGGLTDFLEQLDSFESTSSDRIADMRANTASAQQAISSAHQQSASFEEDLARMEQNRSKTTRTLASLSDEVSQSAQVLSGVSEALRVAADTDLNVSAQQVITPIETSVEGFDDRLNTIDYLFPTLLVFLLMFVAVLLAATFTLKERLSRAYFRNQISPARTVLFVAGTLITTISVVLLQSFVLVGVGFFLLNVPLSLLTVLEVLFVLVLSTMVFVGAGMLIGSFVSSEELAVVLSVCLVILLLLFSNALVPIESMPLFLQFLAQLNPVFLAMQTISSRFLFGVSVFSYASSLLLLLGYAAVFFLLSYLVAARARSA